MNTLSKTRKRASSPSVVEQVPIVVESSDLQSQLQSHLQSPQQLEQKQLEQQQLEQQQQQQQLEQQQQQKQLNATFLGSLSNQSSQFQTFLTSHANDAYTRPWHRLERGVRLNRLRLFAQEERTRCAMNDAEQQSLFLVLTKALDKKMLNSKTVVTYDTEQQKILEIKGLVSHKHADGRTVYQFLERKTGVTSKRKPTEP